MKRFIEGLDRNQTGLLPECIERHIADQRLQIAAIVCCDGAIQTIQFDPNHVGPVRSWRLSNGHSANGVYVMTYQNWLPAIWGEEKDGISHPFSDLRKRIDTLFEDFDKSLRTSKSDFAVRSNVSETDKEICITVELPGVEEKDLDISVNDNRIAIKGEKKSEKEEEGEKEGREFHMVERSSGSFQRSMTLPFQIDADSVHADFKNGVLTVKVPKPPEAVAKTKKVEIKSAA